MAKLRINGDSSGYVDLEAPNAASSSTLDLDQIPQKNATNTFSTINKFADSVSIGGTHSPTYPLDVRSTGQAIVRVDGVGLYFNGIKIRNNYSSVQSDWNVGAAGGSSGWGSANGTFIIRDDTTNSTGLEIEQGAGSNTAALHINSSGHVTMPNQPCFRATNGSSSIGAGVITLTQADFDVTNSYNTSNGRFTAPVTGHYLFYLTALYVLSGTSPTWKVSWWKNNSFDAVAGEYQSTLDSSGYNTLFNSTVTTHMAAGDYMQVYNHSSNVHISGTQTKFGGYLLQ